MEAKAKATYASMVQEDVSTCKNVDEFSDLTPDKVIVSDEDCIVDRLGNFPKITFSDHVHDQIDLTLDLDEEDKLDQMSVEAQEDATIRVVGNTGSSTQQRISSSILVVLNDVYLASNPHRKLKATKGTGKQETTIPMVPGQSVNVVEHASTRKNLGHCSVTFLEHVHGKNTVKEGSNIKSWGFKVKPNKENSRQRLTIRKPSLAKTISRLILTDWVQNVNSQLNSIAIQHEIDMGISSKVIVNHVGSLEVLRAPPFAAISDL
ncbi:hypothetical protein V6N11_004848 [Hibiscus sabdariffa]|uniref:Uncharacterized protein n=1 Tax=Hibiscus sabdariffa TaxID=183260 RepID=A0ABR2SHG6_9ROSI